MLEIRELEREPTVEDVRHLVRIVSKEKKDSVVGAIMDNTKRESCQEVKGREDQMQ